MFRNICLTHLKFSCFVLCPYMRLFGHCFSLYNLITRWVRCIILVILQSITIPLLSLLQGWFIFICDFLITITLNTLITNWFIYIYIGAVDGKYGKWILNSTCNVTCGDGYRRWIRRCDSPSPAHGGRNCSLGESVEKWELCRMKSCVPLPKDSGWQTLLIPICKKLIRRWLWWFGISYQHTNIMFLNLFWYPGGYQNQILILNWARISQN